MSDTVVLQLVGVATVVFGLILLFLDRRLPCHHGKACPVCKEQAREKAIKAEREQERANQRQLEYARRTHLAVRCAECGDIHVPHGEN